MSPTCTIPYEVLLEFANNTHDSATMQVLHGEDGSLTGAIILLHRGESISLVLTAGTPYKYAVKQSGKEVNLSVKIWNDTQCALADVLGARIPRRVHRGDNPNVTVIAEGITVKPLARLPTFLHD